MLSSTVERLELAVERTGVIIRANRDRPGVHLRHSTEGRNRSLAATDLSRHRHSLIARGRRPVASRRYNAGMFSRPGHVVFRAACLAVSLLAAVAVFGVAADHSEARWDGAYIAFCLGVPILLLGLTARYLLDGGRSKPRQSPQAPRMVDTRPGEKQSMPAPAIDQRPVPKRSIDQGRLHSGSAYAKTLSRKEPHMSLWDEGETE
jgi:hypothetical protein